MGSASRTRKRSYTWDDFVALPDDDRRELRVSERRGVMPDVQYFAPGNEPDESQEDGLVEGHPDIAVEIMSKTRRRYDRIVKLGYYLALAVPEYWLIDPVARTLERFVLSKKGYVIRDMLEGDATFAPKEFRGLKIPLGELWSPRKKR